MEDGDTYALIQEVIPNKNYIPFRERFAKLTLSSHKKEHAGTDKKALNAEMPSVSSVRRQLNKDNNILLPKKDFYNENSKKNTMAGINFTEDAFVHETVCNPIEELEMIGNSCSQLITDSSKIQGFRTNENSSSEDDSIITVSESDSSDNHQRDDIIKSSETVTNNSLDRIANFLSDVSITNKALHHKINASETQLSDEALTKAHLLAIADTESMNELLLEEESDLFTQTSSEDIPAKSKGAKDIVLSLADTVANISTDCNSFTSPSCNSNQSTKSELLHTDNDIDVTVNSMPSKSVNETDASIIIEDTDESVNEQQHTSEENDDDDVTSQSIMKDSKEDVDVSSEACIQQHPKANINISAKINIQINISSDNTQYHESQRLLSSSTSTTSSTNSSSKKGNNSTSRLRKTGKLHPGENFNKNYNKHKDKDLENDTNSQTDIGTDGDNTHLSVSNISDKTFDAEKLLTELYGRSWQTPDIMHSIRSELSVRSKSTNQNLSRKCLFRNVIRNDELNENLVGKPTASSKEENSSAEKILNRPKAYQAKNVGKIDERNLRSAPKRITNACSPNVCSDHKTNTKKSQRKQLESKKTNLKKNRIQPLQTRNLNLKENDDDDEKAAATAQGTLQNTKTKRKLFTPDHFLDVSDEEIDRSEDSISFEDETENDILEDKCYDPINNCFLETKKADDELKENRYPQPATPEVDTVQLTINAKVSSHSIKKTNANLHKNNRIHTQTPIKTYSFLKSLDECVSKAFCHPDALPYRENYRLRKSDLSKVLYDLYNERLFDNKLEVPIIWNKKLTNTAGRCLNKKRMSMRTSVIELSDKVLSSADRLRCTLLHELCHAATWIFNAEGGHGATWKSWAKKANEVFPDIPKIGVCHQYDIQYKYTYKCTTCGAKSHAHSKSKKLENIRCSYCHGSIEVFLNKITKDGNVVQTPVRQPSGFAKFVKDNYKKHQDKHRKHADIMKILSEEFAAIKVAT